MSQNDLGIKMEDHALESVPNSMRQGWLKLSWNTAGIVTTLIQLFFGALTCFVAGFQIALLAGIFVTIVGGLLGWGTGHIAYKTGLSSTVMARQFGFGNKGSILGSVILGFMIIGFLALENALLYAGFKFAFNLPDTLMTQVLMYGAFSLVWIGLTAYGFDLVSKFSSWTLVAFLLVLLYMTWSVVSQYAQGNVFGFPSLFPPSVLESMGANSAMGKFIFCVNILIGSSGALALVDADMGRYSKSSRDIGIAAFIGSAAMSICMMSIGGIFMFVGMEKMVAHYMTVDKLPAEVAQKLAMSPDGVTATFLLFGGVVGVILMLLAQGKAQVLNTYSASLSLTNISDALGKRVSRVVMVVVANLLALIMIAMGILGQVQSWIEILGVITTAFASVMIMDYFFVSKRVAGYIEQVNWAGVVSVIVATILAHYVLNKIIPIQFFTSMIVAAVLYPVLRTTIFCVKKT